MNSYSEARFKQQVESALKSVQTILHNTRQPAFPSNVFHKYDDKYNMVTGLTNATLASHLNCLEMLGATKEIVSTLQEWGKQRSVTLRLKSTETCVFDREVERKVESPTHVLQTKGFLGKG